MTNIQKRVFSVVAAGVMMTNIVAPALASTTIEISGNGAGSDNFANVVNSNTTTVSQTNNAIVTNSVNADADTGNNEANFNTGGNVGIQTGNAQTTVNVANNLNSNAASVNCCANSNTDVKISGNGANSTNTVGLTNVNATGLAQNNVAVVTNLVEADADTGDNDANLNTGGNTIIKTGNAKTNVDVETKANTNSAVIGGHSAAVVPTPSASFQIVGNGAGSDNYITAGLINSTTLAQGNNAIVTNVVEAEAETGDNDADFNTGGDVVIFTGNAETNVDVDNMVNFNHAAVNCGCDWGVLAKIAGNGAEAGHVDGINTIALGLTNAQNLGQGNNAFLNNLLDDVEAETGDNDANLNTGDVTTDPAVVTGNAVTNSGVSNSGNVNTIGGTPLVWPWANTNVNVSFNVAALMAYFGISIM